MYGQEHCTLARCPDRAARAESDGIIADLTKALGTMRRTAEECAELAMLALHAMQSGRGAVTDEYLARVNDLLTSSRAGQ